MPTTIFGDWKLWPKMTIVSSVEINTNEYSWRERLEKLGFKVDRTFESHPTDQAGADHGIKDGCNMNLWVVILRFAKFG